MHLVYFDMYVFWLSNSGAQVLALQCAILNITSSATAGLQICSGFIDLLYMQC